MNLTMLYRKKEAAALGETMRSYRQQRATGENWAYEYQLTKTGILVSPHIAWISAPSDL